MSPDPSVLFLVDGWGRQYATIHPVIDLVQMLMLEYVPDHGWLTTRRGLTHQEAQSDDVLARDAKNGYRAMQKAKQRATSRDTEERWREGLHDIVATHIGYPDGTIEELPETRPCPACGAPLKRDETHFTLGHPPGGYMCPTS